MTAAALTIAAGIVLAACIVWDGLRSVAGAIKAPHVTVSGPENVFTGPVCPVPLQLVSAPSAITLSTQQEKQ